MCWSIGMLNIGHVRADRQSAKNMETCSSLFGTEKKTTRTNHGEFPIHSYSCVFLFGCDISGNSILFFPSTFFRSKWPPFLLLSPDESKTELKGRLLPAPPPRWSIQQSNLLKGKPTLNFFLVLKSAVVKICANPLMCHAYTCGAFTPCDVESESCHIRRWWRVGIIKYAGARPEAKRKRKARDQFK